ncbi:MAG: hypothetical protein M1814_001191 [Vezdaea aestivalis]|nr:MAG: hypothetical protein M1814_001191 [Vezdaea aestivalis]
MSVRKAHNAGRNHLRNVVDYYQQIGHEKAQSVIDSITSSYAAEGQASSNPMLPQNQPGGDMMGGMGGPGGPGGGPPFPFPGPGGPPMPFGNAPPFPGMPPPHLFAHGPPRPGGMPGMPGMPGPGGGGCRRFRCRSHHREGCRWEVEVRARRGLCRLFLHLQGCRRISSFREALGGRMVGRRV